MMTSPCPLGSRNRLTNPPKILRILAQDLYEAPDDLGQFDKDFFYGKPLDIYIVFLNKDLHSNNPESWMAGVESSFLIEPGLAPSRLEKPKNGLARGVQKVGGFDQFFEPDIRSEICQVRVCQRELNPFSI